MTVRKRIAGAVVGWRMRQFPRLRGLAVAVFVGASVTIGFSGSAVAQQATKPLYDTKIYFPKTRSYYEMVVPEKGDSVRGPNLKEISWGKAQLRARERRYKGVPGRLAIVRSQAVSNFLFETFRPKVETWIGLRYWCSFNKLQWVDGKIHERSQWSNWDVVWNKSGVHRGPNSSKRQCHGKRDYWPVHYWSVRDGFRWNANAAGKEYYAYFIEYPTGRK